MDTDNPLTQEATDDAGTSFVILPDPSLSTLATIEALTAMILHGTDSDKLKFAGSVVRQVRQSGDYGRSALAVGASSVH